MTKPIQTQTLEQITEPGERWLPVVGFDGYMVSDLGRVWSCGRNKMLKQKPHKRMGHVVVSLNHVSVYVHRAILSTFIGPSDGLMCRHINSTPNDNRLINLTWGTAQDNADDIPDDTRAKRKQAHIDNHARGIGVKLTPDNIRTIRSRFHDMKRTKASIAREFGVCEATIRAILTGEVWSWVK